MKEKEEIGKKLTPIVELASKTLSQQFKSWSQVVRYVEKIDKGKKRAVRLTDPQMKMIEEMKAANKKVKEIAQEVGCKENQVRVLLKKRESGK